MQLNEILEENSVKAISKKTNISEDNIEALLAGDFDKLKKVKTLGFISIIEREYKADLGSLREQALSHYTQYNEVNSVALGRPIMEEKKGKSKLFLLFVLLLLGYASWYFFTQFDKKQLSDLLPFSEEKTSQIIMPKEVDGNAELSIENVIAPVQKNVTPVQDTNVQEKNEMQAEETVNENKVNETENTSQEAVSVTVNQKESITISPVDRLWFGIIDMETKQRDHFSISEKFELDIKEKNWLLATSSAPFSIIDKEEIKEFNDAKEHYFKIDKSGIEQLTKADYIAQGGWSQW